VDLVFDEPISAGNAFKEWVNVKGMAFMIPQKYACVGA
jgi:hypothetical protein